MRLLEHRSEGRSVGRVVVAIVLILLPSLVRAPQAQAPIEVARERRVIPGFNEPNSPPNVTVSEGLRAAVTDPAAYRGGRLDLNQAVFLRFFDRNRVAPPKSIVVFLPGLAVGANMFTVVAREIVSLSVGETEAWAVDSRSNLLEDTRPLIEAERTGMVAASLDALRAYQDHPAGPGGYIANHPFEVSGFMSEWGLDVYLRDVKAIVEEARRRVDPATPRVLLAGHDFYGASLVANFAAYNFDGVAGYALLAGLILLDGTPAPNAAFGSAPRTPTDEGYLNTGATFGTLQLPGLNVLRNPQQPGDEAFLITSRFNPFTHQVSEIAAQLAVADPEGRSALPAEFAPTPPATNAAAMALMIDDEFTEADDERFSVGFLRVPAGGKFGDVANKMPDPEGANPNGYFTPKNLGSDAAGNPILQRWDGLKDLTPIGLTEREVSDPARVARGFLVGDGVASLETGEANYLSWYFPKRLLLDMLMALNLRPRLSAAVESAMRARGGNTLTETENARVNISILGLPAERGILVRHVPVPFPFSFVFSAYAFSLSARPTIYSKLLPDYAHRDVTWSSEPLVPGLIVEFARTGKVN
ncbi:MAG: hypothetical protein HY650_06950 [Acidobacteria bacterium]|nr:hypothetical protein [Acidobacteriota bacterium]